MDTIQASVLKPRQVAGLAVRKLTALVIVTGLFGWLYAWAVPWAFPADHTAGFGYGVLHGAMMPLSLPSLVVGRDVPIYDDHNDGRVYKIGYICGVNLCGLAFLGPLFWRPRRLVPAHSAPSP